MLHRHVLTAVILCAVVNQIEHLRNSQSFCMNLMTQFLCVSAEWCLSRVTYFQFTIVRCEQYETVMKVKECMQQQWSHVIVPGYKVKVKIRRVLTSAVVEKSQYIAKLSSNC